MARPKKGAEIGATARIALRIPQELREAFDVLASKHGRSLSDEIRAALESHAKREARR